MDPPRIIVTLRGSAMELHELREQARTAGMSLNNYVRHRLELPIKGIDVATKKVTWKNVTLMRKMCDKLWSKGVLADWAGRCAFCGKEATDAHHLVPRQFYATRHDLQNGMALCQYDHIWNPAISPHQNAGSFCAWLAAHHPARMEWYLQNRRPPLTETKNAAYYCGVIRSLQQYVEPAEFTAIVGVKFAAWLEEIDLDKGTA